MKDMFHRGASIKDIAKRIGRTDTSVCSKLNSLGLKVTERDAKNKEKSAEPVKPAEPVKVVEPLKAAEPVKAAEQKVEKTLNDFKPREMIKHLYDMGYRIKGDLYQIVERKVLLTDIIG